MGAVACAGVVLGLVLSTPLHVPFGAATTAAGMAIGTGMAAMGLAWRLELARRWQLGFGAMWRLYRPSAVPKTATAGLQAFPA
jgi:hypothetical protein